MNDTINTLFQGGTFLIALLGFIVVLIKSINKNDNTGQKNNEN